MTFECGQSDLQVRVSQSARCAEMLTLNAPPRNSLFLGEIVPTRVLERDVIHNGTETTVRNNWNRDSVRPL